MLSSAFAWTGAALFAVSLLLFLYSYFVTFGRPAPAGDWIAPVLVNAALFSAFAVHHSLLARTRMREAVSRIVPPHLERALYTWTASLLFIVVCWQWQPVPGVVYVLEGPLRWLGFAVQAAGMLLTHLGSASLDVFDLAGVRQAAAPPGGTTAARTPLKTTGAYGLVRHPIYLGWVLLVFGSPTMTATRLTFAIISTGYLAIAIPWEERGLIHAFGRDYREYQRQVRWRMLPGIY